MAVEGLGRVLNVIPIAAGKSVSLKDAQGVTFVVTGNDTFTVKSQPTAGGSATNLAVVTRYYTATATDGTAKWVLATQAAAATVVIASGAAAFYIDANDLPSAAKYVEVTVGASGLVVAVVHDLEVQRDAANLAALNA
ncbi:MAG TPA: hypothetical protein VGS19_27270 [Streptosporangiaceae bacterium]|nr:hypothetical protein [Streptosporangiaceae bacterium]